MVARVAVASSRSQALGAALGMGWWRAIRYSLLGLQSIFHAVPAVYVDQGRAACISAILGFLIFTSYSSRFPS